MMQTLSVASAAMISALVTLAGRSFLLAAVAGAGLAIFRLRATSVRLFIWTSVLYASLAMPFLGGLLHPVEIGLPQFPQHRTALPQLRNRADLQSMPPAGRSASNPEMRLTERHHRAVMSGKTLERESEHAVSDHNFAWPGLAWSLAAGIYLLVTFCLLARFAAGILWTRKLLRSAKSITHSPALGKVAFDSTCKRPRLSASENIVVPLTVGAFRATILLPSDWSEWETQKLHAVLAHELSHVDRYDVLTQRLALVYRAIFWFNPLAWWLHAQLAVLAEQASDEAALSEGVDQKRYAGTLLDFIHALRTGPGRVRWQGVSMARVEQVERRLERILAWKGAVAMNTKRSLAAVVLVLAVPVVYLAAAVHPAPPRPADPQAAPLSTAADVAPVAPESVAAPSSGVLSAPAAPAAVGVPGAPALAGAPAVAPVPATPAIAAVAPTAPMAPIGPVGLPDGLGQKHSTGTSHNGLVYSYGYDDEERFVIASSKIDTFTMSGSSQDARHVEKLKKQIPGDFIWFQRDEKSYVIRDQATIDRAKALWTPQEELGRRQEELGKQQEELGKQQEALGAKMEQVKVNVPNMTEALDRLKAKLQKLGPTATMEQVGELQSEIGELQSEIGELQSEAGERQGKLGELQGELGEKQGKLGEQQGELGRQQAELAEKATREMKALLDEALKNGTAKPEEEIVKSPTL